MNVPTKMVVVITSVLTKAAPMNVSVMLASTCKQITGVVKEQVLKATILCIWYCFVISHLLASCNSAFMPCTYKLLVNSYI